MHCIIIVSIKLIAAYRGIILTCIWHTRYRGTWVRKSWFAIPITQRCKAIWVTLVIELKLITAWTRSPHTTSVVFGANSELWTCINNVDGVLSTTVLLFVSNAGNLTFSIRCWWISGIFIATATCNATLQYQYNVKNITLSGLLNQCTYVVRFQRKINYKLFKTPVQCFFVK